MNHPVFSFTSKNYYFFTQNKDILFLPDFSSLFILLSYSLKNYIALKRNDRLPELSVVKPSPRAVPCQVGSQEPFLQQMGMLVDQGKVTQKHRTKHILKPWCLAKADFFTILMLKRRQKLQAPHQGWRDRHGQRGPADTLALACSHGLLGHLFLLVAPCSIHTDGRTE